MISSILAWIERRRRFKAALAYNTSYTFAISGQHASTWQCPTCCRIHRAHSFGKFSGPQFDACCDIAAGGRTERQHAVPHY